MITQEQFSELVTVEKVLNWLDGHRNRIFAMNDIQDCLFGQYLSSLPEFRNYRYCVNQYNFSVYYDIDMQDYKFPQWATDLQNYVIDELDANDEFGDNLDCEISGDDLFFIIESEEYEIF